MRTLITPGRLYARMSSEFRRICCDRCAQCVLPVPYTAADGNWQLGELPGPCEACEHEIQQMVRRYRAKYDLLDPFSPLVVARDMERRATRH